MNAARLTWMVVPALLLVGCSGQAGQPQRLPGIEHRTTGGSTAPSVPRTDTAPGLRLDLGEWAAAEQSGVLVDYLAGFGESMRTRAITEELYVAAAYPWMQERREDIARAKRDGLTVPDTTIGYVERLDVDGADAVARLCMWAPSAALVGVGTAEPVDPVPDTWTPRDVTMVLATTDDGDAQWYVISERRGSAECDRKAPR
jgi:hypothetical protein